MSEAIRCENVVRIFQSANIEVQALQGLNLSVHHGELLALVGASGSGKSTLMSILSAQDQPSAGIVQVAGHDVTALRGRRRVAYQRDTVGFVWQQTKRNLLPYLSSAENIALPMRRRDPSRVRELLEAFGVSEHADTRPGELTGGQAQRVALAVAMANAPTVLLADEPTGDLDEATTHEVFEAIRTANRTWGVTVLVVTHDPLVTVEVDRTVAIRDGRTSSEVLRHTEFNADGAQLRHAQEYAVLDRAGRLQLPRDFVETLELSERVRLELEADHIGVWPAPSPQTQPLQQEADHD